MARAERDTISGAELVLLGQELGAELTEARLRGLHDFTAADIAAFLAAAGGELVDLEIAAATPWYRQPEELSAVPWPRLAPRLRRLRARELRLPAALLGHLAIEALDLVRCALAGDDVVAGPALQELSTEDTNMTVRRVTFGPSRALRSLRLRLDEDSAEAFIDQLVLDDLPALARLYVHVEWPIDFTLRGALPSLSAGRTAIWRQHYSKHRFDLSAFTGDPAILEDDDDA